jgi:Lar family restriction alleviation protein
MTPNETAERELKPCPFCGSTNIKFYNYAHARDPDSFYQCADCGTIPGKHVNGEEAARREWNRRAASPLMQNGPKGEALSLAELAERFAGCDCPEIVGKVSRPAAVERTAQDWKHPMTLAECVAAESAPAPISDERILAIYAATQARRKEIGYPADILLAFARALLAEAAPQPAEPKERKRLLFSQRLEIAEKVGMHPNAVFTAIVREVERAHGIGEQPKDQS